ncbi:MAG TPA: type II toxin-antitoxin system prevent-host-death family antitoxin [Candidatus Acidoferrales bacterium]|nr:type II toxin-antitoxin system prevent-host-death family antitoxin [Candidatus Acidoferrales bacterium]
MDFAVLSMTELRTRPGEILDRVADGEAFVIERSGQRKACLVPLSVFFPDISPSRISAEIAELNEHGERPRITVTEQLELAVRLRARRDDLSSTEITIVLPHRYPSTCPRVYADIEAGEVPHRWADGALCLYGVMTGWNPGKHTVLSTLALARRWLEGYDQWRNAGQWPSPSENQNG